MERREEMASRIRLKVGSESRLTLRKKKKDTYDLNNLYRMLTADGDDIWSIGVAAWTERINIGWVVEFEVHCQVCI